MFGNAVNFDQDISGWDVSSGTNFVSNDQGMYDSIQHILLFGSVSKVDSDSNSRIDVCSFWTNKCSEPIVFPILFLF